MGACREAILLMTACVLGSGTSLRADLTAFNALSVPWPPIVVVVNETGVFYPHPIDYWVTMHGEKLDWWRSLRDDRNYDARVLPGCDGSSGGAAVKFAQGLADKIVLCGMPMDGAHIRRGEWKAAVNHHDWWTRQDFSNVRSFSGWTRELLGAPTREWLGA